MEVGAGDSVLLGDVVAVVPADDLVPLLAAADRRGLRRHRSFRVARGGRFGSGSSRCSGNSYHAAILLVKIAR